MKRTKVSLLLTVALAGVLAATVAGPASADPTPQPKDVVGVGSDTTEYAVNFLADGVRVGSLYSPGYNASAGARLVSFNATGSTPVVLKSGTTAVTRPNGSGAGKATLFGAGANSNVNFARSSSSLSAAEVSAGLWQVPFALDGLKLATATTSNAPASITAAQLVGIYNGSISNWNQIGGASGAIVPMIPQTGSGTRTVFLAQLQAANGGVAVTLASTVVEVQEHDAAPIAANANAVAPFSTGRAKTATGIKLEGGWSYTRALYNVVRSADLSSVWFTQVFGADGFVCSGSGQALIEAAGFDQLSVPADGGVCGVPTQAATTNLTVN
ncbi:substrate-binding domain-containing protein [Cellulomonas soli]|uniref:substrate-binding domain-containing protein n=1 Tax=Cellulomonas soli TaxID=931535 RepID=UPI003F82D9DF